MAEYTAAEEIVDSICSFLVFIIIVCFTIHYGTRVYSDFCTKERSVLNFRRAKPEITPGYKRLAYLTYATIIFTLILSITELIEFNFARGVCDKILAINFFDKLGYGGAKCTLYIILIYRLHEVYGNPPGEGYNPKILFIIGVTIILVNIGIFIGVEVSFWTAPVYFDDTDTTFPFFCQISIGDPYIYYVGVIVILNDLILSFCACLAFIIPLNRLKKQREEYDKKEDKDKEISKQYHQMVYFGYKYKVLVLVAVLSTLIWLVLFMLGVTFVGTIFAQADFIINPLCLMLMTPYYPSDLYYERLCCLCICCCDPKRQEYQSKSYTHSVNDDESPIQSLDTSMAMALKIKLLPSDNVEKNIDVQNKTDPDDANL